MPQDSELSHSVDRPLDTVLDVADPNWPRALVALAIRAPSFHNTQPWRFRPRGDAIDVLCDPNRTLPISDPSGWATRVALGAVALNLRLGYASLGWETEVRPLPDRDDPNLLIRVQPVRRRPATPAERSLVAAVPHRHTNRRGYLDQPVLGDALAMLATAATVEGGWLRVLDPARISQTTELIDAADAALEQRPGYREERRQWSRKEGVDGVRPDPLAGPRGPSERLRRRDFGSRTTSSRAYESDPCVAVLGTSGASAYDDLRAGQALQRVLLTATEQRLTASMYSQPIEVATTREQLADVCGQWSPQMVLRFGYGTPHAPTARRPVDEVLDEA